MPWHVALAAAATLAPAQFVCLKTVGTDPDELAAAHRARAIRRRKSNVNEVKNAAAMRIQGLMLIVFAKRDLRRRLSSKAARTIQRVVRGHVARRAVVPRLLELQRYLAVSVVRPYFHGKPLDEVPVRFRHHVAAARIQSAQRRSVALDVLTVRKEDRAARSIQNSYRRLGLRKRMVLFKQNMQDEARRSHAATAIAAAARGFLVRLWFNEQGGRAELLAHQRTHVASRQRGHRLERIDKDTSRLTQDIGLGQRSQEERDILRMVLACANPNTDVVEWSAGRLRRADLQRRVTTTQRLPPISTIPAQAASNDKDGGRPVFEPQPQPLEPGLQSLLVTEPTGLLASSTTRQRIADRAASVADRRLRSKYGALPHESATMRYVLSSPERVKAPPKTTTPAARRSINNSRSTSVQSRN
jgi:hypothetical protein